MNRFQKLFRSHAELSPGEQQRLVEQAFPNVVRGSPLRLWSQGAPREAKKRLVIGVATYAEADMRLLDLVADALARENRRNLKAPRGRQPRRGVVGFVITPAASLDVQVFSVLDCRSHDDFEKYIPGIGKVFQTPVTVSG
jgi:hypothetical protein